jgi:hypothetical protein
MLAAAAHHHPVAPLKNSDELWITEDLANTENLYPPPLNLSSSTAVSYPISLSAPISPANVPGGSDAKLQGAIVSRGQQEIVRSDSYSVQGNGSSGVDIQQTLHKDIERERLMRNNDENREYPSPRSTIQTMDFSPGTRSPEHHRMKSPNLQRLSPQEISDYEKQSSSVNLNSVNGHEQTVPLTWPGGKLPNPQVRTASVASKSATHVIKLSRSETNPTGLIRTSYTQRRLSSRRSRLTGNSNTAQSTAATTSPSKEGSGSFPTLEKKIVALENKVDQLVPAIERLTLAVDSLTTRLDGPTSPSRPTSRGKFSSIGTSTGSTYVSPAHQVYSRNPSYASRSNPSRRPSAQTGPVTKSKSGSVLGNPFEGNAVPEKKVNYEFDDENTSPLEVAEMARKFQSRGRQMSRWDTETEDEVEDEDDLDYSEADSHKEKAFKPLPPLPTATVKQVRQLRPSIVMRRSGAQQPKTLNVEPVTTPTYKPDIDVYPTPSGVDWEWGWPLISNNGQPDGRKVSVNSTSSTVATTPMPATKLPPLLPPTHSLPPTPVTPVFMLPAVNSSSSTSSSPAINTTPPPPPRPAWYFFYGPLRDPALLHELLGLIGPPILTPARVWGFTTKYFGVYPAAVEGTATDWVGGMAWYVPRIEMAEWLRKYEEEMYVDRGVDIEFEGGEKGVISGRMFVWKGGAGQLCNGPVI